MKHIANVLVALGVVLAVHVAVVLLIVGLPVLCGVLVVRILRSPACPEHDYSPRPVSSAAGVDTYLPN